MIRKLRWVMILLLVTGAAGLGYKLRNDWRTFRDNNNPKDVKLHPGVPAAVTDVPQPRDYTVVAQQNPFHPERNDAMPPPPPVVAAPSGPPPLIYGSMILGTERFALMATEADPKSHKVMEGDSFNGYKLAKVLPQSVVLQTGDSQNEVMLYNALSRLRRDTVKTQPSSAGTPTASPNAGATTTEVAPTGPAVVPAVIPSLPGPNAPAPPGKKLVETPFGPMWVDK
jgi:hypothetical protein